MNDDNDKAQAFFILNDADVVEQKVADVFRNLFLDTVNNRAATRNGIDLLYSIMRADAAQNHPVMNDVLNEMFHSGRLRMNGPANRGDFIDSLQHLIRGLVQEEIQKSLDHIGRRVHDLKRAEYNARNNYWK